MGKGKGGLYTHYFVDGLSSVHDAGAGAGAGASGEYQYAKADCSRQKAVTVLQIAKYTSEHVLEHQFKDPACSRMQHPTMEYTGTAGDFLFVDERGDSGGTVQGEGEGQSGGASGIDVSGIDMNDI